MSVKVKDLKNQTGVSGPHPFLYCLICGSEFSANAGDYWDTKPEHVFRCCEDDMLLVTAQRVLTERPPISLDPTSYPSPELIDKLKPR